MEFNLLYLFGMQEFKNPAETRAKRYIIQVGMYHRSDFFVLLPFINSFFFDSSVSAI